MKVELRKIAEKNGMKLSYFTFDKKEDSFIFLRLTTNNDDLFFYKDKSLNNNELIIDLKRYFKIYQYDNFKDVEDIVNKYIKEAI